VQAMASKGGLMLDDTMHTLFERGSPEAASARAEAERNAMLAIAEAQGSRSGDVDLVSRIGMIGEQPEADLAAAKESLAAGDLGATLASADDAYRGWSGAWQEGRRRLMFALAAFATLLVLVSAGARAFRRNRRSGRSHAMQAAAVADVAPGAPPMVGTRDDRAAGDPAERPGAGDDATPNGRGASA
jgi:hypothetical protein